MTMSARWVFPVVTSCGFGNNFFALVRAHLIAESCALEYQTPLWPACTHVRTAPQLGYGLYFPPARHARWRWWFTRWHVAVKKRLGLALWPLLELTKEVSLKAKEFGIVDVGEAFYRYLAARGLDHPERSLTVLVPPGNLSEYAEIRRGRSWLNDLLLQHARTRSLVEKIDAQTRGNFRVALQVRMGDFVERGNVTCDGVPTEPGKIVPGERNVRLPLDWYIRIGLQLRDAGPVSFVLVTDGQIHELKPLIDVLQPIHIIGEPYQDLAGALILARSDLVVCSNSTYCRLAVFLNDRPYIWPADTLYSDSSGDYGYLWRDGGRAVSAEDRDTEDEGVVRRCFALPISFRKLPAGLLRYVRGGGRIPIESGNDLIFREPVLKLRC